MKVDLPQIAWEWILHQLFEKLACCDDGIAMQLLRRIDNQLKLEPRPDDYAPFPEWEQNGIKANCPCWEVKDD